MRVREHGAVREVPFSASRNEAERAGASPCEVPGGRGHDARIAADRRSFEADPAAVGAARHFVRAFLEGDERTEDAELIVSELATNALRHAGSPFTVALTLNGRLRIDVGDTLPQLPTLRAPSPEVVDGRGLQIVAAVATSWGTKLDPGGGKVVWAELDASPAAPRPS